jgi:hypothetical protein
MQVGLVAALCCCTADPFGLGNLTSQQCDLPADLGVWRCRSPRRYAAGRARWCRPICGSRRSEGGAECMTACMAYQANVCGIVPDVGFYRPVGSLRIGVGQGGCYKRRLQGLTLGYGQPPKTPQGQQFSTPPRGSILLAWYRSIDFGSIGG